MPATIVVGVDGSDEARKALEWALAAARTHSAAVRVVHAYSPALGDSAAREADLIVRAEIAATARDDVETTGEAVPGAPVRALLDASADAELLVVGSRGRHGFPGLLLGSVSQQLAHHATCPVVIVPSR